MCEEILFRNNIQYYIYSFIIIIYKKENIIPSFKWVYLSFIMHFYREIASRGDLTHEVPSTEHTPLRPCILASCCKKKKSGPR